MKHEKSCGAVVINDGKVLLIQHIMRHWDIPKGHMEQGETQEQTAIRELKEETNIDIKIEYENKYEIEYSPEKNITKKVVYFIATNLNNELKAQPEEVKQVKWIEFEEAIEILTFDNAKNVLRQVLQDINKN